MNSSLEYSAFKNNRSQPYAKVAQGIEYPSTTSGRPETEPLPAEPAELELGRLGVSVVKRDNSSDTLPLNYVNPHEAENRATIEARLKAVYEPYIQAARLAIPDPRENERGVFGSIKQPYQSTHPTSHTIVLNGKKKKKLTNFTYEATKRLNILCSGHTKIDDEPITTDVYFENEQAVTLDCSIFVNHVGSKEGEFPPELAPIVELKNGLNWDGVFKIRFSLVAGEIGAKITNRDFYRDSITEELIYNVSTNTFDFKSNATLESLTPDSFIQLVEACIAFTPLEKI